MFWNLSIHLLKTPLFLKNGWLRPRLLHLRHLALSHWPLPLSTNQIPPSLSFTCTCTYTYMCLHFPHLLYFCSFPYMNITPLSLPFLPRSADDRRRTPLLASLSRSMRAWPPRSAQNQAPLVNRIMLRFRPIAPKPVGEDASSAAADQSRADLTGRRVKRKYVRIRARQSKRRPRSKVLEEGKQPSPPENSGVEDAPPPEKKAVTLQLLGGRSESEREICDFSKEKLRENRCRVEDGVSYASTAEYGGGGADSNSDGPVVVTWIVVEGVTDKFTGVGLGFSDKERIYSLERDTCPGFVSDWTNNVIWVNAAYKKMVAEDESAAAAAADKGFLVWLVVKEEIPQLCPSFACKVRVTQQNGQGQKWNKIVPCDVWRMEFGGFAWKLDVNTALSLGF